MSFSPDADPVPTELRTADFLLRPLLASDAERDYEAVMACQVALRRDNGDHWPRPDFTVAENLVDLQGHEADFRAQRGYTYTVLDPSGARCLGCVYIYPAAPGAGASGGVEVHHAATYSSSPVASVEAGATPADAAEVRFWVRADGVPADLDQRLLTALLPWLRNAFTFAHVRSPAWASDARRMAILHEAGLREVARLQAGDAEVLLFA